MRLGEAVAGLCRCRLQSALHLICTRTLCCGDRRIGDLGERERERERERSVRVVNFEACVLSWFIVVSIRHSLVSFLEAYEVVKQPGSLLCKEWE